MSETSWKSIAAKLAAQIESGELAAGSRMPSGDALAQQLNVNRNVAHRALEELQRSGMVIRRQGSGTLVAERRKKSFGRIALLVDGYSALHNFPSGELLRGIQDRIGEETALLLADSKHDPVLEARQLRKLVKEADGILIYACAPERSAALQAVLDEGHPIVAIDRIPKGVTIDAALTDNRRTAKNVVESFIKDGHRRIGFLGLYKPSFSSVADRFEGYRDAMAEAGLESVDLFRWLPETSIEVPSIFERLVQDTIMGLRYGQEPITALFCAEDCLGCAMVVACDRLGIHIQTDLEIATFIDWHPMTLHRPWEFRRVVQRKYELGHAAASLLLDRIVSPNRPQKSVLIEADIYPSDGSLQVDPVLYSSEQSDLTKEGLIS